MFMILAHNETAYWYKCENFHLEYQKTNMPPKNDIQIYHSQKEAEEAGWKIVKGKLLCPECSLKEKE